MYRTALIYGKSACVLFHIILAKARQPLHSYLGSTQEYDGLHAGTLKSLLRPAIACCMQGLFVRALGGELGQQLLTLLPFTVLYLLHIVYSAAVLINLLGCFWLFTGKVLEDPHTSWLASVGEHISSSFTLARDTGPHGSVDHLRRLSSWRMSLETPCRPT